MKFRYGNGDQPLDGFTIQRGVGIGGFGEVYFATTEAGKEVALKQIQRNLEVELRGVRHCLNLKHPNLIALYDIQLDEHDQGWIVMEYVSGESLKDVLDRYPQGMPTNEVLRWFGQIAAGVCYLHDHGIVHRDLKPANVFEDEGIVKVGDYGLAKFISASRRGGQTESVGTCHYMAPEVGKGEYGKEIDIYALGVMLFEMITGTVPFDGQSSQEIIMKHLTEDPDTSMIPEPFRRVIRKALEKNPAARFQDVREMVRPLGMRIDERSMLVVQNVGSGSTSGDEPLDAHVLDDDPPVVRVADRAGGVPRDPLHAWASADVFSQEPVARAVRNAWERFNHWINQKGINPGVKNLIWVALLLFLVLNAADLIVLAAAALTLYIPYFVLWWLLWSPPARAAAGRYHARGPMKPQAAWEKPTRYQEARRTPRPPPPKRISEKQWRVAQRMQLAQLSTAHLVVDVSNSWLGSAFVIAVVSALVGVLLIGRTNTVQPVLIGLVWTSLVSLSIAWIAIGLGKKWQTHTGDGALRRFVQLTWGFAVGAAAYLMSEYLLVPWSDIAGESISEPLVQRWSGFFAPDGRPLLPAYLAYFPLVMGLIGWWKQVDPLRRARFNFWGVVWAAMAAGLVYLLIPFPQPWGMMAVATASIAVQLATRWINPATRGGQAVASAGGVI